MEAQRFPYDFDGIVAGAPVFLYKVQAASNVWMFQRLFRDRFVGNLAFDTDGDGSNNFYTVNCRSLYYVDVASEGTSLTYTAMVLRR